MPRPDDGPCGILLIDKPAAWTSHDVVAKARRICRQRRIGHTGTLDPMATGLLLLCLGRATRLVEFMAGHEKRYEGVIQLGATTTTDDAEGEVLARAAVAPASPARLRELEAQFSGPILQRPPAYSAVKVAGKRAYAVARAGGEVTLAPRPVTVHRLRLRPLDGERLAVTLHCAAGTYVRSLARDIGEALGCGAHLAALRRTAVGPFDVAEAVSLDLVERLAAAGRLADLLLPPDEGLPALPVARVAEPSARALSFGAEVGVAAAGQPPGPLRVYDSRGRFLAVGSLAAGRLRSLKSFSAQ